MNISIIISIVHFISYYSCPALFVTFSLCFFLCLSAIVVCPIEHPLRVHDGHNSFPLVIIVLMAVVALVVRTAVIDLIVVIDVSTLFLLLL